MICLRGEQTRVGGCDLCIRTKSLDPGLAADGFIIEIEVKYHIGTSTDPFKLTAFLASGSAAAVTASAITRISAALDSSLATAGTLSQS
jgi:hypothetical protein